MVPDSEASHEELVKRLRIAASRGERERVARIKHELATRRRRKPALKAMASAAPATQTRRWWNDD